MKKYEYKIEKFARHTDLNKYGKDGWELVQIFDGDLIFKREIEINDQYEYVRNPNCGYPMNIKIPKEPGKWLGKWTIELNEVSTREKIKTLLERKIFEETPLTSWTFKNLNFNEWTDEIMKILNEK